MQAFMIHGLSLVVGIVVLVLFHDAGTAFLIFYLGILSSLLGMFLLLSRFHPGAGKFLYAAILLPTVCIATVHADNLSSYGPLLKETIDAIFQTSNAEALAYLHQFSSPWLVPTMLTGFAVTLVTLWRIREPWRANPGVILGLLAGGSVLVFSQRALPLMIYETGIDYARTLEQFSSQREPAMRQMGSLTTSFRGNIVVIIGESLSRHHLQIYGYPRNTTPHLATLGDQLTIYRDVISTHSQTTESLSKALTFNQRHDDRAIFELPDVLSVADHAGMETWWLSNQNAVGVWDNVVSAIARTTSYLRLPGRQHMSNTMIRRAA
jgi:heptose-I-phosphate ethanolaminephosphotransferase